MRSLFVCLAALSASFALGCDYNDDSAGDYVDSGALGCGQLSQAVIDTDEVIDVEPAAGAGAYIEYQAGGSYRVTTSCDVEHHPDGCDWDIVVSLLDSGTIDTVAPISLEPDDFVSIDRSSARLIALTRGDFDGFSLRTAAGTGVSFDALLDGGCANRYMFWIGDGGLHGGSPSNPLELDPSSP